MGIGMAMHKNPWVRGQMRKAAGSKDLDDQEYVQNFGLMGAYAGPAPRQRMNEALRVRRSEMSPSTARQMNRKGG